MGGRRTMGAVDSIWLSMDRPDNLMVIDSIMLLDGSADWERLEAVVARRLVERFPVFSQRAVDSGNPVGMPHWEDDESFALSRHLHRTTLEAPGDTATLQRFVEAQMARPLPRDRPLWELHLVDGHVGGDVVVARFHHALADGIALAQVLLSLTDDDPDGDLAEADAEPVVAASAPSGGGLLSAAQWVTRPVAAGVRGARQLLGEFPSALNPAYAVEALTVARQTGHIADKLLLGQNPPSVLQGETGVGKRAVWSRPRSLQDIKRVGRAAGATVNDVLVGAVSGAISEYVVGRGGDPEDLTTMVPVNLRGEEPLPRELGNKFALVMLPLPTSRLAPLQRLSEAKLRMDSIKQSPEAMLTFGIINAIGRTNPDVARFVVDFFAAKAIGVTTNVVGPMTGRYLAGTRIDAVLGWVPGSGQQTVGVCIFSYDGVVRVGFKVDAAVVTAPETLVEAFDDEMDTLVRLASA
jgi:WS/DGAT/MGAT family acyltransferase